MRALWAVALTLFVACVVQAIVTHRTLYQDGCHYLVVLLQAQRPTSWFWARHIAQVLTQWPLVLALRAGLTDLDACMILQAVGLLYLTPLVVLVGLRLAAGDRALQVLVLLFVGAYYLNADLAVVSESHVFAALALLACLLLVRRGRLGLPGALALVVLAALLLRCYESMLFSGVVLAGLCVLRMRRRPADDAPTRLLLLLAVALFLAGVGIAVREVLAPVSEANRAGFLDSVSRFRWVHGGILFVAVAGASFLVGLRRGLAARAGVALLLLSALVYALQPWLLPGTITPGRHPAVRVLTSLPLALLLGVAPLAVQGRLRPRERHLARAVAYLLVVLVAQSIWHLGATSLWSQYVASFRSALGRHQGFVLRQEVAPEVRHSKLFSWGWTDPTLSVLLSPGGRVQAIFGDPTLRWQPFDPTDPERLPKLERYGVDYAPYLATLLGGTRPGGGLGAGNGDLQ